MDKILVGIPTLNNPKRLLECLSALYKTHDMYKKQYEIRVLVLDDCSLQENLEENKKICASFNVNLLMHNKRSGIPISWNDLVNHCDSEYCILLNDDVYVSHNWIDCVIYTLKNNSKIGVVGLNAYEGEYNNLPPNNIPTYIESKILIGSSVKPLLSARGFAFGFRKADFVAISGFDCRFFCFFEEIDFNFNMMKLLDKRNCMLSYPILKHVHGDTISKFSNHSEIFLESKHKFEEKWGTPWNSIRNLFTSEKVPAIDINLFDEWNSNINIWESIA